MGLNIGRSSKSSGKAAKAVGSDVTNAKGTLRTAGGDKTVSKKKSGLRAKLKSGASSAKRKAGSSLSKAKRRVKKAGTAVSKKADAKPAGSKAEVRVQESVAAPLERTQTLAAAVEGLGQLVDELAVEAKDLGQELERTVFSPLQSELASAEKEVDALVEEFSDMVEEGPRSKSFIDRVESKTHKLSDRVDSALDKAAAKAKKQKAKAKAKLKAKLEKVETAAAGKSSKKGATAKMKSFLSKKSDAFEDAFAEAKYTVNEMRGKPKKARRALRFVNFLRGISNYVDGVKAKFRQMGRDINRFSKKINKEDADYYTELTDLFQKLKQEISR